MAKKIQAEVNRSHCIYFPGDLWDRVYALAAEHDVAPSRLLRWWAEEGLANAETLAKKFKGVRK